MSMITLTGGCSCGAIRHAIHAPADELMMFRCHCRDCQRLSGAPFCPVVFVPTSRFQLTRGTPKKHATDGAQGPHIRGFCPDCGSRLTGGEGADSPGIGITAGSLDDPSIFQAQWENWTEDTQPWDQLDPNLPHFANNPPA